MTHFGLPRRSLNPKDEDIPALNWRRGLFRVWLLFCAAWLMSWIIYLIMYGLHGGFKTIGDLLPKLMTDLKLEARRDDAEIGKVWNAMIDPAITAHAQPANLHKGTLFVNVDSSAWLSEIIRYRRKEILERLQNSFGRTVIEKISFRIG